MQPPESSSTVTYKERSRGLTAKAIERFKGVGVFHDGDAGTSSGHAICLVAGPYVAVAVLCSCCDFSISLPHAFKSKWHVTPNISNK